MMFIPNIIPENNNANNIVLINLDNIFDMLANKIIPMKIIAKSIKSETNNANVKNWIEIRSFTRGSNLCTNESTLVKIKPLEIQYILITINTSYCICSFSDISRWFFFYV